MDHKAFLASLSSEKLRQLEQRRDGPAIFRLAVHGGLIFLLGFLIAVEIPWWPVLMLPQGILIVFLFTLEHETAHQTAFASDRLNAIVGRICGCLVFVPTAWFRYFHFAHHRHTQDPDNDPELEGGKPDTRLQYFWHITGLPLWWAMLKIHLANANGSQFPRYVSKRAYSRLKFEARLLIGIYCALVLGSIAMQSTLLLWVWVLPAIIGQPFLRLYLLAEHGRCPFVSNMLNNTRTTFTNSVVRWVAWNMPYHAEHHTAPTVPFHQLPALHELVREHLGATSDGYVAFHKDYVGELR